MIEFKEEFIPEKRQSTLTTYINEIDLLAQGKKYAIQVMAELIKQSITIHRIDIENMIVEYIISPEVKEYIKNSIHEQIQKRIESEINDIFKE